LAAFCALKPALADQGPLLAAASSLRSLWPALMAAYTHDTGEPSPRASFGSSGLLSTQILNGAPFELFLSADLVSIERLPQHLLAKPPQVYATGELSLVVPSSSPLTEALSLDSLAARLRSQTSGDRLRLAIPNPKHAPYGVAAREVLDHHGIWPLPAERLLIADNAAQTLQFVKSGAVAAAIVPKALVIAHDHGMTHIDLPTTGYQAVKHYIVVFKSANKSAQAFGVWLLGENARQILEDSGLQVATR